MKRPLKSAQGRIRNANPTPDKASSPTGSVSLTRRLKSVNRWREQYNPLRYLTIQRAVYLIESYPRGLMSDLQWTMGAPFMGIENSDPDLLALIERRTSAIGELDWNAKTPSQEKAGADFDQKLADDQAAAIREAYDRIDNLQEAIEHTAMPTFRGYSHCEKWTDATGEVNHLEIVDQWNVVRDGLRGQWKYNPDAVTATFTALPDTNLMVPANYIYREVKRPVNRIALIKFIRANLSDKDWDAFIEVYGIPGGVIIGPPNVPVDKEAQYEAAAAAVAEGGSGYIPHGSEYKPNDSPRGNNPFRDRLEYLTEKLILAGTGGLLTMLAKSGTGTLGGNAHQDTFNMLARAEARKISEAFQQDFDAPLLDRLFPGKPHLAYWELAANEETAIGDIIEHAKGLADAGFAVEVGELSERTGYDLTERAPVDKTADRAAMGDPSPRASYAQNRARARNRATQQGLNAFLVNCEKELNDADVIAFKPALDRLKEIDAANYSSTDQFDAALKKLISDLPGLAKKAGADPKVLTAWQKVLGATAANGLVKNSNPNHDEKGRFAANGGGGSGRHSESDSDAAHAASSKAEVASRSAAKITKGDDSNSKKFKAREAAANAMATSSDAKAYSDDGVHDFASQRHEDAAMAHDEAAGHHDELAKSDKEHAKDHEAAAKAHRDAADAHMKAALEHGKTIK
jgi:phage gp29-like protein